jgi:hypothetical protein
VAIDVVVEVVATDFCIVVEGDSVGEDVIVKVFSPLQRNLEPSTDIPKAMIIIIATETATRNQRGNPIHSTSQTKALSENISVSPTIQ